MTVKKSFITLTIGILTLQMLNLKVALVEMSRSTGIQFLKHS